MNERILEFAKQTGYIWHASGDPQIYEFTPTKLERFAELVTHDEFTRGVIAERNRIINLFMIMHEAAKGTHNYWHVAANLIQADIQSDVASDT